MQTKKIIVAIDCADKIAALNLIKQLDPALCKLKIGLTLFTRYGPNFIECVNKLGFEVFLDLKLHDIPMQVAGAVKAAADMGVWMLSLHLSGGAAMLRQSVEALSALKNKPLLVGISILTSLNAADLQQIGFADGVAPSVNTLTQLAATCQLDGIVCSALEVKQVKQSRPQLLTITPGIRLENGDTHDQKRVMTPTQALANGSDYLVIGRAVTQADAPADVLQTIAETLYTRGSSQETTQ